MSGLILSILSLALLDPVGAAPQEALPAASADTPVVLEEVVVTGRRRGDTGLTPEVEWGAAEIDAIGAWDVSEVVARLSETVSPDEPPVIIVNGRRVVNASDFLRFPPDALVRVEALPPDAAGQFGAAPGRRVVNIVMRPRFESRDALLSASAPTGGGTSTLEGDLRQSGIEDDSTRQFGLRAARTTALWSDERPGYGLDHPGTPDRTLAPSTDAVIANFATTQPFGDDWSASLSVNGSRQRTRFTGPDRDRRIGRTELVNHSLNIGGGVNGEAADWNLRAGLDGLVVQSNQEGLSDTKSRYGAFTLDLSADRRLAVLPAGPARINLSSRHLFASSQTEVGGARFEHSVQDHEAQGSLTIPLSRAGGGAARRGDATLTLGARVRAGGHDNAVDEGFNAALAWTPVRGVRVTAQAATSTDSPSARQLLDPVTPGPARVVFDYRTGAAVEVATFLGGNADLGPQSSTQASIGLFAGPFTAWRIGAGSTFLHSELSNGVGSLPYLTAEVEAAFPERFTRSPDGQLVSIDLRPVNLDLNRTQALASTLNLSVPVRISDLPTGTLQLGLRHSLQLSNTLIVRNGFMEMNRLHGDGGGLSRQQLALTLDGRAGPWGANASMQWRSGFRVRRGSGRDGPEDLLVEPMATVDLRLSYSLTRSTRSSGPDRGRRDDTSIDLMIGNLFDRRPEARLGGGRIAPGYGRYDRDPAGRIVQLRLTRRF